MDRQQPPFVVQLHEHRNPLRRLLSARSATHVRLKPYFPNNVPEDYYLDQAGVGWVAGGHRHARKNERFRCTSGSLNVTLRWVDDTGQSWHWTVPLRSSDHLFLVIPAGVWHEVSFLEEGSSLHVASSTIYLDGKPDESRDKPTSYDLDTSQQWQESDERFVPPF